MLRFNHHLRGFKTRWSHHLVMVVGVFTGTHFVGHFISFGVHRLVEWKLMSRIEKQITRIHKVEKLKYKNRILYKLLVNSDCYGVKRFNETIWVTEQDYKTIKEKGYYLV